MKTILLVDDSKVTRELIKVYLIARDVRLLDAADGVEALVAAKAERPDLILCDLRMPRLDGPGLCRALRADPELYGIPVIILTSNRDAESQQACRDAGARAVLLKPIGPQALHQAVDRLAGTSLARAFATPQKP
ncbi:MAG TPA: response regulator [Anaeromyxobacteraceae bacterium]|nr:response regulator [Anaeromyxobacteraceae bacterium]